MSITHADVEKMAHLSRLAVTPEEVVVYAKHLSNILELLNQLHQVDTKNITPMAHPIDGMSQRLRPDVVTETDQHTLLQTVAPFKTVENLYLVPQVIE